MPCLGWVAGGKDFYVKASDDILHVKHAKGNYLGKSGYFYTFSKNSFKNRMESEEENSFIQTLKHVYFFSIC